MNGLTQSRALVNSVELIHLSKHHRYNKSLHSPTVGLVFQQNSGKVSTRTHNLTHKHILRQFAVPLIRHRRSIATVRHRYYTAMNPDSDSKNQAPENDAAIATNIADDGASSSSLDDRSVVADDEQYREANENGAEGLN